MAYDGTYLALVRPFGPFNNNEWDYHTTDSPATVGAASYITDAAFTDGTTASHGKKGLRKGDIVNVYHWSALPDEVQDMFSALATAPTITYVSRWRVGGIVQATGAADLEPLTALTGSATWDAGSIADGDEEVAEITVTGAALGDFVLLSFSLDVADLALVGQVTAANTVTAQLLNNTGGAIDLASATVRAMVFPRQA